MADVAHGTARSPKIIGDNRYLIGDADSGRASQMAIQIELNGGAATYAFYVKVSGGGATTWQAAMAYPVSAPTTGALSGTTSNVWMIDCSGKDVAVDCSGTSGSPELTFAPLVG